MKKFMENILEKLKDILGFESIRYEMNEEGNLINKIYVNSIDEDENSIKMFLLFTEEINKVFNSEYKEEADDFKKTYIERRLVDKFICESICESNDNNTDASKDMRQFGEFIDNLVFLGNKTYEQRECTASFILAPEKTVKKIMNNLELICIPISETNMWKSIFNYPASIRIVDSISVSYVLNEDYKIIGLVKTKSKNNTVKELCLSNLKENSEYKYIYLEGKKIIWCINDQKIGIMENGKWKIKNYKDISCILETFLSSNEENKEKASQIKYFIDSLRYLSENNIGCLFSIIVDHSRANITIDEILKEVLIPINKSGIQGYFKKLIYTPKQLEKNLNSNKMKQNDLTNNIKINSLINKNLLSLIADVDGGLVLSEDFQILDFSRMVKPQDSDNYLIKKLFEQNKFDEKLSKERNYDIFEEENKLISGKDVTGGARSKAAFESSTYGLAVKVSEDGGISIYHRRKLIFEL